MGRRLPEPIEQLPNESNEDFAIRQATSKRRLQIFKRLYRQYYAWKSLREGGDVGDVLTVEGEDFYLGDLMVGLETLPPQQRRAFELICVQGYTESAATALVLPNSKSSTPVQQYSDDGLKKMVSAYDAKQAGVFDPQAVRRKVPTRRRGSVTASTQDKPETKVARKRRKHRWNWNETSEDHEAFAKYIKEVTGLDITPSMVKAVSFLRREWYHSDEAVAAREQRKQDREELKARYAYETPEQREARLAAARTQARHARAVDKANKLADEIKKLRVEAGLDPETGVPVAAQ